MSTNLRRALRPIGPIAVVLAVLVLLYAVAVGAVLPRLAERMLPDWSRRTLGLDARVEDVEIDPFRLRLRASGLHVGGGVDPDADLPGAVARTVLADLDAASLLRREWVVSELHVRSAVLRIGRDASGRFVPVVPDRDPPPGGDAPDAPPPVVIRRATLADARVHYVDRSLPDDPSVVIGLIDFEADGLAIGDGAAQARYTLHAALPRGGTLEASGTLAPAAIASRGTVEVSGAALDAAWPFIAPMTGLAPPGATLDAHAEYRFETVGDATALTVSVPSARLGPIRLAPAGGGERLAELEAIELRDGRIALPAREVGLGSLRIGPGRVAAAVDGTGRIDWAVVVAGDGDGDRDGDGDGDRNGATGTPWKISIEALRIDRLAAAFRSDGDTPTRIDVDGLEGSAAVSAVAGGPATQLRIAELALGAEGLSATLARQAIRASAGSARIDGARFGLGASGGNGGSRDARSDDAPSDEPQAGDPPAGSSDGWRFDGRVTIADASVSGADASERLLGWAKLQADAVTAKAAPLALRVPQARVEAPYARLRISERRELNLTNAFGASGTPPDGPPPRVRIDRIDFDGGTADFADLSLVVPFDVRVLSIRGSLAGLDTTDDARTVLEAEGEIRPFGHARATGTFHALAPARRTAIDVTLENVPMPILTPYLATFAGRTIDAGRLRAELEYRIEDGALAGENRVVASDLSLGERVDAPNALDLPLDLAIAVLTDPSGRLALEVPVTGRLGDPEFDYATVIREALATVVRRVVSAPFRALARLAGGDDATGDALARIEFEPGSDRLRPVQQERLSRLALALGQRPALALRVDGAYDPQRDAAALRESAARREVARAMGIDPPTDGSTAPIALEQPAVQAAIARMLRERGLDAAGDGATGDGATGDDGAGTVSADADPSARWRRLVAAQPLPDAALQRLAASRARRIRGYLTESQGLAGGRIEVGRLDAVEARDGRIAVTLELAPDGAAGPVGPRPTRAAPRGPRPASPRAETSVRRRRRSRR